MGKNLEIMLPGGSVVCREVPACQASAVVGSRAGKNVSRELCLCIVESTNTQ